MIEFRNISKQYNDNWILSDINLKIDGSEFVFIVGPSGVGKTTLVKLLTREEKPTSGEIIVDETNIVNLRRSQIPQLRRQIGVVYQEFKLLEDRTAFENIALAFEVVGKSKKEINDQVPRFLKKVDLLDHKNAFPRELAGGEKQRLALARALACEPKILVADEPTGMIDPQAAWHVINLLNEINKEGTTVIMCTHNVDIVDSLKRRVVQLEEGKIVRDEKAGKYEAL